MKKALVALGLATLVAAPAMAVMTNQGDDRPLEGLGQHDMSGDILGGGAAILYCPSEADDAAHRAAIAGVTGGTVDYYDARAGVPDFSNYDCGYTWANFAFFDAIGTGDALADLVDAGGSAVLGAFCTYTSGNSLDGRIMDAGYCPVVGGSNHFSTSNYALDGTGCVAEGVDVFASVYRDILSIQGDGVLNGTFLDGEIAIAHNPDQSVVYANGSGGSQLAPTGDYPTLIANGCSCAGGVVPVEQATWSSLKATY